MLSLFCVFFVGDKTKEDGDHMTMRLFFGAILFFVGFSSSVSAKVNIPAPKFYDIGESCKSGERRFNITDVVFSDVLERPAECSEADAEKDNCMVEVLDAMVNLTDEDQRPVFYDNSGAVAIFSSSDDQDYDNAPDYTLTGMVHGYKLTESAWMRPKEKKTGKLIFQVPLEAANQTLGIFPSDYGRPCYWVLFRKKNESLYEFMYENSK